MNLKSPILWEFHLKLQAFLSGFMVHGRVFLPPLPSRVGDWRYAGSYEALEALYHLGLQVSRGMGIQVQSASVSPHHWWTWSRLLLKVLSQTTGYAQAHWLLMAHPGYFLSHGANFGGALGPTGTVVLRSRWKSICLAIPWSSPTVLP